jgi:3'(2'), 5'-bisphosphate nucleotidase
MTAEQIFERRNEIFAFLRQASDAILHIYNNPEFTEKTAKNDGSPLTLADKLSHQIMEKNLLTFSPDLPILSEEGANISYEIRKNWQSYWCLDPLDGTKEFLKRNGEFAICLALVSGKEAVAGFIAAPVSGEIFYGFKGAGAFKIDKNDNEVRINTSQKTHHLRAVGSRSHASKEDEIFLAQFSIETFLAKGSALKFCAIAEGEADFYYRSGPTMEWDTAAGQAILEAAGGKMLFLDGEHFTHNKENLLNPSFYCLAAKKI